MFSENTECYLKSIKLEADGDKRTAHLRFFLTPASYELAAEAHPQIAERLFRKNGSSYDPVLEMTRVEFALNFPEQQLTYRRHPEYVGHEVMIPNVEIGKVSAQKVIAGSPDFSLIFTASFEILDKTVITDLVSLLHEKFFLTFTVAQLGLFDEDELAKSTQAGRGTRLSRLPRRSDAAWCRLSPREVGRGTNHRKQETIDP
jgi:hypothetical protein